MCEEHTRLITQLVTLMRVSVVLFTGLRGDPTARHKNSLKPKTQPPGRVLRGVLGSASPSLPPTPWGKPSGKA